MRRQRPTGERDRRLSSSDARTRAAAENNSNNLRSPHVGTIARLSITLQLSVRETSMKLSLADTGARDHRIGDERRIFAFEADFADDLRCIPMIVRFKLDRVGIKLSLKQWTKVGPTNRTALLTLHCDAIEEVLHYRRYLVDHVTFLTSEPIVMLQPDPDPAWANPQVVPEQVKIQAAYAGLAAPTMNQWAKLSTLERFALLKLARSNHDNENFAPAMRELRLCT
jgi:hypothetical protein